MAEQRGPDEQAPSPEQQVPQEPLVSDEQDAGATTPPDADATEPPQAAPTSAASPWQILGRALFSKATPSHILVGLLCALLGFAVVVQVRQTRDESLSSLRQADLVRILDEVTQRSDELETQLAGLKSSQADLLSGEQDNEAALEAATQRAATQGILSGRLPATGPGVTISIVEDEQQLRPSTLVTVLEELRNAGAEAIELNGIRIVASSYFVDSAQGLVADGQVIASPYEWIAIGNPDTLAPALEIPGGAMATVRSAGARGTITAQDSVTVEAVREPTVAQFAQPLTSQVGE